MRKAFNGERLKKARIYRGFTVAELAEKVSQQRQTLSMYEINKSNPPETVAAEIARELHFPLRFFYQDSTQKQESTVYFRSLLTTNKKYRSEQIIKMQFLSNVYDMLQDYIEFPEFDFNSIKKDLSPEEAARELRKDWGLGDGPIDNLVSIVEQHGIIVTSYNTRTDDIDAFSELLLNNSSSTFLIAYSNNKTSAARIHFDIAHELGHICLHEWSDNIEDISREDFKTREQEANDFAASFLLPKDSFMVDLQTTPLNLLGFRHLKKKWKVSMAAMIRRSKELGVIDSEVYQNLIRTMQRRGLRKEEPLDDVLLTAEPSLLKTAVLLLLQEEVFTPKEFMDELDVNYNLAIEPNEVEFLLDLPKNTLATSKIIQINPKLQIKNNI